MITHDRHYFEVCDKVIICMAENSLSTQQLMCFTVSQSSNTIGLLGSLPVS
jgi:hypothetical protein